MADTSMLKTLVTGVDQLVPRLGAMSEKVATLRKNIDATGLSGLSLKAALNGGELAKPFVSSVQAASAFETAMVAVGKAVHFDTPAQFKAMGDDILKLSTRVPTAAKDITELVAAGAQSGIARGELVGFAEDAVKMGLAFDQSAAQSGAMMAAWRTAFKMTQAQALGLADQIADLGHHGRASGQQILDIVNRVGPLGGAAGNVAGQVAALGATLVGLGVGQEQAGVGVRQLMQALAQGGAATDAQAEAFKALRLDSKDVAAGMQQDAQGTLMEVLRRVAATDANQRPALLATLFGGDSAAAITPLLNNLGLLESNLARTGNASQYAGAMQRDFLARAGTADSQLTMMRSALGAVSVKFGEALLPAVAAAATALVPLIDSLGDFIGSHPALVQGLAAAGMAFQTFRVVLSAVAGTGALLNPLMLTGLGIAAVAGLIVANWDSISAFFQGLWASIQKYAGIAWSFLKLLFDFSPLGMIVSHWEPILGYFRGLVDKVRPLLNALGLGSDESGRLPQAPRVGMGAGDGAFVMAGAPQLAAQRQLQMNQRFLIPPTGDLLSAGGGNTRLNGELTIRLEGDTRGIRPMAATSDQPGLLITTNVGRRTLSGGQQ
ncbi:phage tail tape measure protein [Pseudomonas sp. KNUC1026]|uniref:phage tail tape measure protein n=1 Tax=Pseudomonas sp. KNUC1026 TaxID=2893890 RepID=UPI001F1C7E40|nr:phage tail tape measure protein [Pseudomonas sp. KNUC1026]UFH49929.1 phage tail tape measure protein [Pseudomonas sp. KNUC1026]